eukprot:10089555-Heterocapsa_arctica.AAC.1
MFIPIEWTLSNPKMCWEEAGRAVLNSACDCREAASFSLQTQKVDRYVRLRPSGNPGITI